MNTRYLYIVAAVLLLTAATPQHPNHSVRLDRLQVSAADNDKYLQIVAGKVQPSSGVPLPVFVDAALNVTTGVLPILRDGTTGVLTLPSAPNPPQSLHLYVNGLRQVLGRDIILNGTIATPGPDQTLPDGRVYTPKGAILDADEIVADYRR